MDWSEVEPVLKATYRLLAERDYISGEDVIAELGRPPGDAATGRALDALSRADYIEGQFIEQSSVPVLITSTEKGLQEASGWPKPGGAGAEQVELLLRLLDERIASAATPEEEKGRLRRARDAVAGVGREVFAEVLAAYVARQTGLGD
jgi:hypothetical protein